MKTTQVRWRKIVKLHKQIEAAKISISLQLATALILTCAVARPVQAENKLTEPNWKIAKENVDKFAAMDYKARAALFDRNPVWYECNIDMDDNTALRFYRNCWDGEFSFLPQSAPSMAGSYGLDPNYEHPQVKSETVYTGAKRKDEKEYWSIIKANLDKFIGMSSAEITAVLGPERCSSKPWNRIDYRIGDAGLTFYLKDDKVEKFRFKSNVYIPGT